MHQYWGIRERTIPEAMRVTQIVEISKSRSKVYLDQESPFVLYKGELRLYHIKEGEELADSDYQVILQEILPKRARLRSMNLLKSRDYTAHQLRIKLKQGFYPENVIEDALAYVESYHYIDDARYARDYITYHECSKSRMRITQDLHTRGISDSVIENAFQEWGELGGRQDERVMIRKLLDKKHYDPEKADFKEYQKIYAYLCRKGYSSQSIRQSMGSVEAEFD